MKNITHKFGFGTAKLHHVKNKNNRFKLLDTAYNCGFRHFDTSPYYGNGICQNSLYEWIFVNNIKDISVASKFGLYPLHNIYTKRDLFSFFIKLLEKLTKSNYKADYSFETCDFFISKYNEAWGVVPNILFLHEPSVFLLNSSLNELPNILGRIKQKYPNLQYGFAGENINLIDELYQLDDFLIQTKFASYKKADFYYACFSTDFHVISNYINHQKSNDKFCMLYSSTKINRINEFSKNVISI